MAMYRVVPFVASVDVYEGSSEAAAQLEALIKTWTDVGWEYVRMESLPTSIAGHVGCFGTEGSRAAVYTVLIFRQ
jgi:hypothetical protein